MEYKCVRCNSTKTEIRTNEKDPSKVGLYCKKCGRWIKWLSKEEKLQLGKGNNINKSKSSISKKDVVKFIKDLDKLAKSSKIFKSSGDKYIMTNDLLEIMNNFVYEHDIKF